MKKKDRQPLTPEQFKKKAEDIVLACLDALDCELTTDQRWKIENIYSEAHEVESWAEDGCKPDTDEDS